MEKTRLCDTHLEKLGCLTRNGVNWAVWHTFEENKAVWHTDEQTKRRTNERMDGETLKIQFSTIVEHNNLVALGYYGN